ncbi:hypothetical protein PT974_08686 [Cladobotryum mycophilum]|uniref:Uncharacterized protein n=1 Tax=Cladobotryum mycophilum TaxID=491253 RepID=A0ABR0SE20_9HYPO
MSDNDGLDGLQIRCAENIAFMTFLGDVPAIPERTRWGTEHDVGSGRVMTREIEKDLVGTLAFLSSIEDDPDKITAVCVQERSHGMCVVVAANDRTACDTPYLQRVKDGFDEIFDVLRMVSSTHRNDVEQQVFGSIVKLCRGRILARTIINDDGAKLLIQTFLAEVLEGIDFVKSMPNKKEYKKIATELSQSMDRYDGWTRTGQESYPDAARDIGLEEIIDGFYRLYSIQNLLDILSTHPMAKRLCKLMFNAVGKMAQYRSSATRLVTLARGCPVARRASTVIVTLEPSAFERPLYKQPDDPFHLTKTLDTISASNSTKFNLRELSNRMDRDIHTANATFEASVQNIMDRSKIHAEVQLVSYLDAHPAHTPPRFIASSKDACYLCNAFTSSRGRYVLTRTHGKIYPGWRLPATIAADVQQDFNIRLEQMIGQRAGKIMQGEVQQFESPWESTLFSAAASIKSALSLLRSGHDDTRGLGSHDGISSEDVMLFKEVEGVEDVEDVEELKHTEEVHEPRMLREASEVSQLSRARGTGEVSKFNKLREATSVSQLSKARGTSEVSRFSRAREASETRQRRQRRESRESRVPREANPPEDLRDLGEVNEPRLLREASEVSQLSKGRGASEVSRAGRFSRAREASEVRQPRQRRESRESREIKAPDDVKAIEEPRGLGEVKEVSEVSRASRAREAGEVGRRRESRESRAPREVKALEDVKQIEEPKRPKMLEEASEVNQFSRARGTSKVSRAGEASEVGRRRESRDSRESRELRAPEAVKQIEGPKGPGEIIKASDIGQLNRARGTSETSRFSKASEASEVSEVSQPRLIEAPKGFQDLKDLKDIKEPRGGKEASEASEVSEISEISRPSRPSRAGRAREVSEVRESREPPRQPREFTAPEDVREVSEVSRPSGAGRAREVSGVRESREPPRQPREFTAPEDVREVSEISKFSRVSEGRGANGVRELREVNDPRDRKEDEEVRGPQEPRGVKEVRGASKVSSVSPVSSASEAEDPKNMRGVKNVKEAKEPGEAKELNRVSRPRGASEVNRASKLSEVSQAIAERVVNEARKPRESGQPREVRDLKQPQEARGVGEVGQAKSPKAAIQVKRVEETRDIVDVKDLNDGKDTQPQNIIKKLKSQPLHEMFNRAKPNVASNMKLKRMPQASRRAPPPSNDKDRVPWQHVSRGETKCGFRSKMLRVMVEYTSASEPGPLYFKIRRDTESTEGKGRGLVYDVGPDAALLQEIPWSKESRFVRIRLGNEIFLIELDSIKSDMKVLE